MNKKITILLTVLILFGTAVNALAQRRAERTAGAKAYYGNPPAKTKYKTKKNPPGPKFSRSRPSKKLMRTDSRGGRRRLG